MSADDAIRRRFRMPKPAAALAGMGLSLGMGAGLCACAGCGVATHGQTTFAPAAASASAPAAQDNAVRKVSAAVPTRAHLRRVAVQPGQVLPIASAPLFARIAGYVGEVRVDIGDKVVKDQPLLIIDVPELAAESARKQAGVVEAQALSAQARSAVQVAQAGIVSAKAKLAEARAAIEGAKATAELARSEADRAGRLARTGAVTPSIGDEARSKLASALASLTATEAHARSAEAMVGESAAGLEKAKADLIAAEAAAKSAEKDWEKARAQESFAEIKAPFDGVVTQRGVDPGYLVAPGPSSTPLLTVVQSDRVTVAVGIPEAEAVFADPGDPVEIVFEALGGRSITGKITRASWALDPATRTLRAEIDLPNADGSLRPGLFARTTVIVGDQPNALTIPKTAAVADKGEMVCYVIENRAARKKTIQIGLSDDRRVEVVSGLDETDRVIDNPASLGLSDGQAVDDAAAAPSGS